MAMTETLPLVAGALFAGFFLWYGASSRPSVRGAWIFPAILSGVFLGWSLYAVVTEGPTGFWPEHVRNLWGNQIWFDLLLAAGVALTVLVPRARDVGMRPLPWCILVMATGSIGLLSMLARYMYLEEKSSP